MRNLTAIELKLVSGAGGSYDCCTCSEPKQKGNNGWGNGAEGTNKGSTKGGTAGSKSDESWDGPEDGPRPSKFTTR